MEYRIVTSFVDVRDCEEIEIFVNVHYKLYYYMRYFKHK